MILRAPGADSTLRAREPDLLLGIARMTRANDRDRILDLIHSYAALIDTGRLDEVGDLFERSTYRTAGNDIVLEGAEQVRFAQEYAVKLYDGIPRTHHNITNVRIHVADDGRNATAESYFTVIQAPPGEEPRIIVAGRYSDTFARTGDDWHFTDRLIYMDLVGRLDDHLHLDRMGGIDPSTWVD
ncbi:MAG: nuclear transport factor 2 family protein [Actinobacteria bacterium ATB1]|nr:nuclear transport factor 2 family protein [Actinobacteria bacterium ATB1]